MRLKLTPDNRFYAPWCGHCKNLQPAFEKAAKSLKGLAKLAAVNCDDDMNKEFCGSMGVRGYPTLKIVRPGKKRGKHIVEEYRGGRTAKSMVEEVVDKIPNHVDRLKSDGLDEWFEKENSTSKAILFTKKGATSALFRSLAIDFLGSITFGQMRNSEVASEKVFGISEFPKLVLLPGGDKESIVYDGEMKKESMVAFLSRVATPNKDPPAVVKKPKKSKSKKQAAEDKKKADEAAKAEKKADEKDFGSKAEQKVVKDEKEASTEEPVEAEEESTPEKEEDDRPKPLPFIASIEEMRDLCFNPTAGTCLIALLPDVGQEEEFSHTVIDGLTSLAQIKHKYEKKSQPIFPFYAVPAENEVNTYLRKTLNAGSKGAMANSASFEIFIVSAKRGWWRRYRSEVGPESGFGVNDINQWIEHVKSGAGQKQVKKGKKAASEAGEDKGQTDAEAVADVIDQLKPGTEASTREDQLGEDEKVVQPEGEIHDDL